MLLDRIPFQGRAAAHTRLSRSFRCLFCALFLALTACGSSDGSDSEPEKDKNETELSQPEIRTFKADTLHVIAGQPVSLQASFQGKSARIEPAIGAVTSDSWYSHVPEADTEYTLTVTGDNGQTLSRSLQVTVGEEPVVDFAVTLSSNAISSDYLHDSVEVVVDIRASEFEIDAVRTSIGNVAAELPFVGCDTPSTGCTTDYSGSLDLTSLPSGQYALEVTVTDANSRISVYRSQVTINRPPKLTITAPISLSVINSDQVQIDAHCQDQESSCTVRLLERVRVQNIAVVEAEGRLFDTVELPLYGNGDSVRYRIEAVDEQGQITAEEGVVLVGDKPSLVRIYDADAEILDYNTTHLVRQSGDDLVIVDMASGNTARVSSPSGKGIDLTEPPKLLGNGLLFIDDPETQALVYFYDGAYHSLVNAPDWWSIENGWLVWTADSNSYLFNRDTQQSVDLGNGLQDIEILADGTVFYTEVAATTRRLRRVDGVVEELLVLTEPVSGIKSSPNGKRHAYLKALAGEPERYQLTLSIDGVSTSVAELQPAATVGMFYVNNYLITDTGLAYLQPSAAGVQQAWFVDEAGNKSQRSFFNADAYVHDLGDNGEMRFRSGNVIYQSRPAQDPVAVIDVTYGSTKDVGEELFYSWGRSLFKVTASE